MKRIHVILFFMFLSATAFSQIDKMKDLLMDTDDELTSGLFTLRFFDALTGDPVDGATIAIENVGQFTTDLAGKIQFDVVKDDVYYFNFSKEGYVKAKYKFEVVAETIFFNRYTVSPVTKLGAIRIVLDWDRRPSDLDLHVIKEGSYHISYRNTRVSADRTAQLDRDDVDGYGPETITMNKADEAAIYTCFVQDYTNQTNPDSRALDRKSVV